MSAELQVRGAGKAEHWGFLGCGDRMDGGVIEEQVLSAPPAAFTCLRYRSWPLLADEMDRHSAVVGHADRASGSARTGCLQEPPPVRICLSPARNSMRQLVMLLQILGTASLSLVPSGQVRSDVRQKCQTRVRCRQGYPTRTANSISRYSGRGKTLTAQETSGDVTMAAAQVGVRL